MISPRMAGRIAAWLAIVVLSGGLAVLAVAEIGFLQQAERFVSDLRTSLLLPAEPQHPDIIIVAITEETLERFPYRSPVDRGFLADLLVTLDRRQVRAIGLDLLLDQETEKEKDGRLRDAIGAVRAPLVISYLDTPGFVTEKQKRFLDRFVPPQLRGLSNLASDDFGNVRWLHPGHVTVDGTWLDSMPRALARKLGHATPASQVEIAWRGRPDKETEPFRTFPAHLVEALPAEWFRDKIVLVGAVMSLADRHRTPFAAVHDDAGVLPGVMILAHELAQLLDGRSPSGTGPVADVLLSLGLAALGAGLGRVALGFLPRLGAASIAAAGLWGGGFALFGTTGISLPLIAPTLAFAGAAWAADFFAGREARQQKEFVQRAFSRYVSPKVVDLLVRDPSRLALDGERRVMTFMFTDLADFTALSEKMESRALAQLLNEYLEGLCHIVLEHDGTVDKFIGDAVFAIFNAPSDQPDHAARAVRCAMAIDAFSEAFRRRQLEERGVELGTTRIGLHTGEATVGNFGSSNRMEYTALGDAVNTASRLEGINKHLGTRIAVSEATRDAAGAGIAFRPTAVVRPKGKSAALPLFEPVGAERAAAPFSRAYEAAYAALVAGHAEDAEARFAALHEAAPEDGPTRLHLERLRRGERGVEIAMETK